EEALKSARNLYLQDVVIHGEIWAAGRGSRTWEWMALIEAHALQLQSLLHLTYLHFHLFATKDIGQIFRQSPSDHLLGMGFRHHPSGKAVLLRDEGSEDEDLL
ncbi:hypothetical protein K474DRAFT_1675248, partial [Panus rudis PR-1116 ss-1]